MSMTAQIWLLGSESLQETLEANIHLVKDPKKIKKFVTAIVISTPGDTNWLAAIKRVRALPELLYTPLFYQGNVPSGYRPLFDGAADKNLLNCAKSITERLNLINIDFLQSKDLEIKILNYLFSRSEIEMEGRLSHAAPHISEYPLIEVLGQVEASYNAKQLLQSLVQRNLLNTNSLPKTYYTCGACDGGLLNVQKCCPQCHSDNYKQETLVHCYGCGKIGPVPEFLRRSRLICNHCKVHLIEEGIDYDKPKEDKRCISCGSYFSASEIKVICLVCSHICQIKDLDKQELSAFTISRRGEYLIRGIEKNMYKYFNLNFKVIDYIEFSRIVNWQLQLSERYNAVYFSILNLHFNYNVKYATAKELELVEVLMGKLFKNLRSVLRESDLSTRLDGNLFFLLPMTDDKGGKKLISRIKLIISSNKLEDALPELNLQLSSISSENILETLDKDSENILTELQRQTKSQQQFYLKE